ncbi:MAG: DUF3108 domain-containing protein [Nitrospirota bacterium]
MSNLRVTYPIPLSIILHILVFMVVAGIGGFEFVDLSSKEIFITDIVSGKPEMPQLARSIKDKLLNNLTVTEDKAEEIADQVVEEQVLEESQEEKDSVTEKEAPHAEENTLKKENEEKSLINSLTEKGEKEPVVPKTQENSVKILKHAKEKLDFDIYWLGINVGKASLEAVNNNGTLRIVSQIYSTPFISTFYKVEDYAESKIVDGMPVNFRIKQHEGRYRSDKETIFDMNNRKVLFINYLKETKDEHAITSPVLWDVISGFYYLRTQFLGMGKTVYVAIFDSNKFLNVEVSVLRKEKIVLPGHGEVDTLIVKPMLKSEGLFQKKGDILIWLTDDELKIPVRIETEVSVGRVVAELKILSTEN